MKQDANRTLARLSGLAAIAVAAILFSQAAPVAAQPAMLSGETTGTQMEHGKSRKDAKKEAKLQKKLARKGLGATGDSSMGMGASSEASTTGTTKSREHRHGRSADKMTSGTQMGTDGTTDPLSNSTGRGVELGSGNPDIRVGSSMPGAGEPRVPDPSKINSRKRR